MDCSTSSITSALWICLRFTSIFAKTSCTATPLVASVAAPAGLVLDTLYNCLVKWLAPFICFTAEEAWLNRHPEKGASVHLEQFPDIPDAWRDDALAERWEKIRAVRRVVTGALEQARAGKSIGSSLQACPQVWLPSGLMAIVKGYDMADICITSDISLKEGAPPEGSHKLADVTGVGVVCGTRGRREMPTLLESASRRWNAQTSKCMRPV